MKIKKGMIVEVVKFDDEEDVGFDVIEVTGKILTIRNYSSGNIYQITDEDVLKCFKNETEFNESM